MAARKKTEEDDSRPDESLEPDDVVVDQAGEAEEPQVEPNDELQDQSDLPEDTTPSDVVQYPGNPSDAHSVFATGVSQNSVAPVDLGALNSLLAALSPENIANLVNLAIEKKLGTTSVQVAPNEVEDLTPPVQDVQEEEPGKYGRFINNVHKNIEIPEMDMSTDRPQSYPTGRTMRFRNGVYVARSENEAKQLDWMSQNDSYSHDGINQQTVGGNKDIKRDNGKLVIDLNDPRYAHLANGVQNV